MRLVCHIDPTLESMDYMDMNFLCPHTSQSQTHIIKHTHTHITGQNRKHHVSGLVAHAIVSNRSIIVATPALFVVEANHAGTTTGLAGVGAGMGFM